MKSTRFQNEVAKLGNRPVKKSDLVTDPFLPRTMPAIQQIMEKFQLIYTENSVCRDVVKLFFILLSTPHPIT